MKVRSFHRRIISASLKGLLVLVLLFGNFPSDAVMAADSDGFVFQGPWKFHGSFRLRIEGLDGFNTKFYGNSPKQGASSDSFGLTRVRVWWDRPIGDQGWQISLGVQDSRAIGLSFDDNDFANSTLGGMQHNSFEDQVELFNTWLQWSKKGHPFTLKAGRQQIFYGDKRCFGPGNFGNSGRYIWDALKMSWKKGKDFIDVFYGGNIVHDPDRFSLTHRHFYEGGAIYAHRELSDWYFEPFVSVKNDDHAIYSGENGVKGDLDLSYIGFHAATRPDSDFIGAITLVKMEGSQGGSDCDAWAGHMKFGTCWKEFDHAPEVTIEYSYASGDSDPTDNVIETFDSFFGARDTMYGRMNLMHWKNLKDWQANFSWKANDRFSALFSYHIFRLAQARDAWYLNPSTYRDKTGACGDDLGSEYDLVIDYMGDHGRKWQFGACLFKPGKFVENIMTAQKKTFDDATWVYVQCEVPINWN